MSECRITEPQSSLAMSILQRTKKDYWCPPRSQTTHVTPAPLLLVVNAPYTIVATIVHTQEYVCP